jgi:hypothetical protein
VKFGAPAVIAALASRLALRLGGRIADKRLLGDIDDLQIAEPVGNDIRNGAVLKVIAHQIIAGGVIEIALPVRHERAGAGQIGRAGRIADDEETVALDRKIRGRRGVIHRPWIGDCVTHLRFDTSGVVVTATAAQDERRKFRRSALVAGGVHIRDVVGDRCELVRLRIHAGAARAHHTIQTHRSSSV